MRRDSAKCRVEFEHGEVGEVLPVGIEELVVENAAGLAGLLLAEDPLLFRMQKRLRGPALDDVAQGLLAAVRLRQVEIVKQEQAYGQNRRR